MAGNELAEALEEASYLVDVDELPLPGAANKCREDVAWSHMHPSR